MVLGLLRKVLRWERESVQVSGVQCQTEGLLCSQPALVVCSLSVPAARGLSGKSRGSRLSHPLSAGKEEEDEPDSVSVCQQQAVPDSQRSAPVPNPQQQSLACACFGTSAGV